jgi:hypothetical protein
MEGFLLKKKKTVKAGIMEFPSQWKVWLLGFFLNRSNCENKYLLYNAFARRNIKTLQ